MPRLLIVCEYPTLLGCERSMLATLPTVVKAGFDAHVATPTGGPLADALRRQGISQLSWNDHDVHGVRRPLETLRDDLARLCRRMQPDILHANSLSMSRLAGPVAAECGIRGIGHLRDIAKIGPQAIRDINQLHRILAVSHATRACHVAQGLDPAKCVVQYNGVNLSEFRPRPPSGYLHRALNLPPSARLIAVIGQLGMRKGTDVALVAARRVADHAPEAQWLVVGERTSSKNEARMFEAHLHTFSSRPDLTGRVHFLGSRNDVAQIMNECALLVHAARQEPLGRVLLEAAASGIAVVATDVGGTREIFPADMRSAVIVPVQDSLVIADAVIRLLRDEARRRRLGEAARRRAEQAFDIQRSAGRLVEQYQEVLN